jgi:hypothetical protein
MAETITTRREPDGSLLRRSHTLRPWTVEELQNALWLRETPSGMFAAVFGGGRALGFALAMDSSITTEQIEAALIAAGGTPAPDSVKRLRARGEV